MLDVNFEESNLFMYVTAWDLNNGKTCLGGYIKGTVKLKENIPPNFRLRILTEPDFNTILNNNNNIK